MNANIRYKNSVFSLLFSDPDALRELYGAIEGVEKIPTPEFIVLYNGAEEAKVVWREEGMGIGMEKGIGIGREEVARNALVEGVPIELIKKISGLDEEALKHIQARL